MADLEGLGGLDGAAGDGGVLTEGDRLDAIDRLKRHAGPGGALSAEALADRVRRVYQAQTRAGVDQVLADLPRDPPWSMPLGLPPVPGEELAPRPGHPPRDRRRTLVFALAGVVLVAGLAAAVVAFAPVDGDDEDDQADQADQAGGDPGVELPAPVSTLPPLAVPEVPATTSTTRPAVTTAPVDLPDLSGAAGLGPAFVLQKVGQDIAPGRYLSTPEVQCYWERVKGFSGTLDDVIDSGVPFGKHVIVDVLASDAGLRSQGCDFRAYAAPAAPAAAFEDGDWLVGSDVAAGSYELTEMTSELTGDASLCAWERGRDFTHDIFTVIDSGYPAGAAVTVQLNVGERFSSDMCGTWTHT
ncbi:MAG TPA: DUF1707 domain-containing protein [Acidimicrobiales bacterium]|nr:DUF1707 domain-containing protein [Acidimicrobiales bacterium]